MAQEILGQGILKVDFVGDTKGLKAFQQAMKGFSGSTSTMNSAVNKMNAGSQKLSSNMRETGNAVSSASASVGQFSKDMFFASAAIGAMTTGVVLLGKTITDMTFNYDRNMTMVKAVTGATASEFAELSKNARNVGQETEFGATKAAEGLLVLARMGLNAAESMNVLTPAVKLAQSQQFGLKETTELVVQQLKVFGKDTVEAAKFSNILAATASKSAADMEKLSLSLSFVGPVANAAGRSFEEINAVLGLMFNAGIRASRAGTSLRFAFANLMKPTARVNAALKAIGVSIDQVNPATNKLNDIFKVLAKSTEGVSNKASLFFEIFGKRAAPAMTAVITAVQRNSSAFEEMQAKITGTDEAARQFEVQMESFSGRALKLRSSLQEVALSLGDAMMPMLKQAVGALQSLTDWFKNLSPAIKGFIVIVGASVAIGGTFLTGLTAMAWGLGIVGKALFGVTAGFAAAITAQRTMQSVTTGSVAGERQLTAAIYGTAAAQMRKNLQVMMGVKGAAKDIVLEGQKAAMLQKTARSQAAAFMWAVRRRGAAYGLQRAQIAETISTFKATLGQNALSAAYKTSMVQMGLFKSTLLAVKAGVMGLWTAIGGLTGALTFGIGLAIPLIVTAFTNAKAKSKEFREEQEKMAKTLLPLKERLHDIKTAIDINSEARFNARKRMKELEQAVKDGKASKEDLLKVEKEHNELLQKTFKLINDEKQTMMELVENNIELYDGYDIINDKLKIRLDLLDKLAGKEMDVEQLEFEEYLTTLDTSVAKIFAINDALEGVKGNLRGITFGKEALQKQNDQLRENIKGWEEFQSIQKVQVYGAELDTATRQIEKNMEAIRKHGKENIEQIKRRRRLNDLLKKYNEINKNSGTKEEAADLDGLGDAAEAAAKSLLSIIAALETLKRKIENLRLNISDKIKILDAGDFQKEMIKLGKMVRTEMTKVEKIVSKAKLKIAKLSELKSKGLISEKDFAPAKKALDSIILSAEITNGLITELSEKSEETFRVAFANKVEREHSKMVDSIKSDYLDMKRVFDNTLDNQLKTSKLKYKQMVSDVDNQMKDLQNKMENIDATIPGGEEDLDALFTQYEDLFNKRVALQRQATQEEKKIRVDYFEDVADLHRRYFALDHKNNLKRLRDETDIANKRVQVLEDANQQGAVDHNKALLQRAEADQDYVDGLVEFWTDAASKVGSIMSKLASTGEGYAADMIEMWGEFTEAIGGAIASVAKGDYLSALAQVGEYVAEIISGESAEVENKLKTYASNLDATSDNLYDLNSAVLLLAKSMRDSAREAFGFGTSTEEVADYMNNLILDFGGAFQDFATNANLTGTEVENMIDGIQTAITDIPEFFSIFQNVETEGVEIGQGTATSGVGANFWEDFLQHMMTAVKEGGTGVNSKTLMMIMLESMFGKSRVESREIKNQYFGGEVDVLTDDMRQVWESLLDWGELMQGGLFGGDWYFDAQGTLVQSGETGYFSDAEFVSDLTDIFKDLIPPLLATPEFEEVQNAYNTLFGQDLATLISSGDADIVSELEKIVSAFKENIGLSIEGIGQVVTPDAFMQAIDLLFNQMMTAAVTSEDVVAAHSRKKELMDFIISPEASDLWEQLTPSEMFDFNKYFQSWESEMQKDIDALATPITETGNEAANELSSAADLIVSAFNSGAISFEQATTAINALQGTIDVMPEELQDGLTNILRAAKIDLLEGIAQQKAQAEGIEADVSSETEQYQEDISSINDEMNDVITNWQDLLDQRQNVIDTFQTESNKLVEDSKKTVTGLQAQKNEILGIFDFSETQSIRSQRFKAAADIEGKIRNEVEKTAAALTQLTEKYEQDLLSINNSLQKLIDTYRTMDGVYESFAIKRNAREQEYVDFLRTQIELARELGIEVAALSGQLETTLALFPGLLSTILPSIADSLSNAAGEFAESVPTDIGGQNLSGLNAAQNEIIASDVEEAVGNFIANNLPTGTAQPITAPDAIPPITIGEILTPAEETMQEAAENKQDVTNPFGGTIIEPPRMIFPTLFAKGFHGIIDKPTVGIIGEAGAERVDIDPISDMAAYENGMMSGGASVVIIEEHIDLRGAYGIDSPATAERVWNKVWAPARRQAVNRVMDMRGKVQR